jgi:hypothetical protein
MPTETDDNSKSLLLAGPGRQCMCFWICNLPNSGRCTVGRTADLAGQNYKKSVYPFKIEYCKILGVADYEFGVSLMKLKMEETKWWTIFEKN